MEGFMTGRNEEWGRFSNLLARYDRGETAFGEFRAILLNPLNRDSGAY